MIDQYFGVKEPKYLNDVKLQIKDVEYLKGVSQNKNSSINDVYDYLIRNNTKLFNFYCL